MDKNNIQHEDTYTVLIPINAYSHDLKKIHSHNTLHKH